MGAPAASVIVPTRDRPGPLARCLAALAHQAGPPFEIVVVDDGSAGAVAAAVASAVSATPGARLVRAGGRGPAAARNLGAAAARAPVLCFTDDDCRPERGWVAALHRRIEGGAAAVAGPTRNGRPANPFAAASQLVTTHLTEESVGAAGPAGGRVGFAPTSNLACRAALLRDLPFDERFPAAAGEDRDWCARLADRGVDLAFEPAAAVWHDQDLSLRTFWRQQVRYGRGAHRWHRGRGPGLRLQPPAFYARLLRRGFAHGAGPGALVVVAQVATAAGIARETLSGLHRDG